MNAEVDAIVERYPRIVKSLLSLKEVKVDTKYYYDFNEKIFGESGGSLTSYAEWAFGGWGKWGVQAGARVVTGESHDTLVDGIKELKDDVDLLVSKITSVAQSTWMTPTSRQPLIDIMTEIYGAMVIASKGIDRFKLTYSGDLDKLKKICPYCEEYKSLTKLIYKFTEEMRKQNIIDVANNECLIRQKEGRRFLDEEFRRRSLSDMTLYHTAKDKRAMRQMARHLLPDELSSQIMADLFYYLKLNDRKLKGIIDKQLETSGDHDHVLLRKEETHLYRTLQFFKDRAFIHLKEKSGIPHVKKVLRFGDRKMLMCFRRKMEDGESIERAENDVKYLEKYQKTRGIVLVKGSSKYFSKEQSTLIHSTHLRNYDQGSLETCVDRDDLTFKEKCQITLDLLHALQRLHEDGIVHLNIKPDVVLVEKKSNEAKAKGISSALMGFDYARSVSEGSSESPYYMPFTDMWMLGHVLNYLFTGHESQWLKVMKKVSIFDINLGTAIGSKTRFDEPKVGTVEHLIWLLLHPIPHKRPTASQAIEMVERVLEFEKMKEDLESVTKGLNSLPF
ncbi:MAG: hypothetical protein K940chlam3_00769 [Chlamydiae bacterium]|nr:hypothetical protein [Chlamydiota bacterium]